MSREGVTLTWIAKGRRVWFLTQCSFDFSLRCLGNELVLFGQMHQKGCVKPAHLSQIFVGIAAVIRDSAIDTLVSHGSQEYHECAETITQKGNFAIALLEVAYCIDGVLYVLCARIAVISSVQTKAVLPVGLRGEIKIDARLLAPKRIWRDRNEALFGKFVAVLADVGVHPKQFLQNDNGRSWRVLRPRDVSGELAVMSFYGYAIVHCVLLGCRHSSGPPPMRPDRRRALSSESGSAGGAHAGYRGSSLFDEPGCFLRVRHVGHMARLHFDGLGIGTLRHHPLLVRVDRAVFGGDHVPGGLVLPGGALNRVSERIGRDRHLRYSHELSRFFRNVRCEVGREIFLFYPPVAVAVRRERLRGLR